MSESSGCEPQDTINNENREPIFFTTLMLENGFHEKDPDYTKLNTKNSFAKSGQ